MNPFYNFFRKNEALPVNICCSEEAFHQKLKIECKRSAYNEQEFSLILLKLNAARSGQEKRIRKLIRKIHHWIRDIDIVGRYDTESIGVIMPYTSEEGAKGFLHKILGAISELKNDVEFTLFKYYPDAETPEKIQSTPL
ncbi:MAG: GGDEF domain-containing protein [Desulfobacteraceae bacterium]|nr:MAG: GGDEF domain-containing protein [Desulfobacteraceae bacterium]